MSAGPKSKREANPENFGRLLDRLDPNRAQAWHEYDLLRRKLVMFFQFKHPLDAEELAAETLDRLAQRPDLHDLENIVAFTFGVARHLRKEAYRRSAKTIYVGEFKDNEVFGGEQNAEDTMVAAIDSERDRECFLKCVHRLAPGDRDLLLQYYPVEEHQLEKRRQILAETVGVNIGTLRTRVVRLREKLIRCFEKCRAASGDKGRVDF